MFFDFIYFKEIILLSELSHFLMTPLVQKQFPCAGVVGEWP